MGDKDRDSAARVFVGGLIEGIRKEDLEGEFEKYGKLSSVWVAFNPPGFAFVEFYNATDAENAVDNLNGTEFLGSKLRVEMARGRSRRGGGRGGGGSRRGDSYRDRGYGGGGGGSGGRGRDRFDSYGGGGRRGGRDRGGRGGGGSRGYGGRDSSRGGGGRRFDDDGGSRYRSRSPNWGGGMRR